MNAECKELKAHIMARFDIESIIEEGGKKALEDTIAIANNMYFYYLREIAKDNEIKIEDDN